MKRVIKKAIAVEIFFKKVSKAVILIMIEFLIQSIINLKLIKLNKRKKKI